jgi:hypothetical protein
MKAARLTQRHEKATQSVTGRLGRVRCRGYAWLVVLAFLTPRRIVAGILTASAGTAGAVATMPRRPAPATQPAPQPQPVVVRQPLPEGVTETDVQKWVPNRRVSGRTELKPWQSVDAARARNPEVLRKLLQPVETEVVLDESAEQEFVVEETLVADAGSVRKARKAGVVEIGADAFARLSQMLSDENVADH